jgi:hypothetical protein
VPELRSTEQRKADVLEKLRNEVDLWVASASATGEAYLIPLSFIWHNGQVTVATTATSRTARNLQRAGKARLALGQLRDVIIIEGSLAFFPASAVAADLADAFAMAAGFDPRRSKAEYVYISLTPRRIQAWREENELAGREIMRDGQWLA